MRKTPVAGALLLILPLFIACSTAPVGPDETSFNLSFDTEGGLDEAVLAGQLLAFGSDRAGFFNVFVIQGNGSKQTQLTDVPGYNARPNWSHDGRKITFTACRVTDFSCEIYVMNADGSGQTNLTNNFSDVGVVPGRQAHRLRQ